MVFIYGIQLEEGKYYIGKTNSPQLRLKSHFNSNGSEWTKIYKPIRVIEIKPNCDDYDEDKITIQYMNKYGIDNVRGGSFVSVKLKKSTIKILKEMINGTNNKCFICEKAGHFAKDCKENKCESDESESDENESDETESDENESESEEKYEGEWECEYCNKIFMDMRKCVYHEKYCDSKNIKKIKYDYVYDDNSCFRCGRVGHNASSCYASKHINGYYIK